MRKLNKREKDIIRELVDYYKDKDLNTISLFLTDRILPKDLKIVIRDDGNYLLYGKEEKKRENLYIVVEIFNLFRELIYNKLITVMPNEIKGMHFIGEKQGVKSPCLDLKKAIEFENGDYILQSDYLWYDRNNNLKYSLITFSENDFHIKDFIVSVPLISPELIALVESNFETTEEKTLFATQIAAFFTFLAFLAAILIPTLTSVKLNKRQHKEYIESIQTVTDEISHSTNQITDAIDNSARNQDTFQIKTD